MSELTDKDTYRGNEVQFVLFELEDEIYAVEIHKVIEILKMVNITPIPGAPDFIEGIINLRGKIVVVTDLKRRFNLKGERSGTHIIIVESGRNVFGVIVDDVLEVLRVVSDEIKEALSIITEKIHTNYLNGVLILNDKLIILLNIDKIFSEEEMKELGGVEGKEKEKQETDTKEKILRKK